MTTRLTTKQAFELWCDGHPVEYKRGESWYTLIPQNTMRVFQEYSEWRIKQ